jgi:CRISPR-associated protein Cas2
MPSPAPFNKRHDLLITYDVDTTTKEGRGRLRRIAKLCEAFGQRVQFSVFECRVNMEQFEEMQHRMVEIIDPEKDSLRIYRLQGGREGAVVAHGRDSYRDFDDALVI